MDKAVIYIHGKGGNAEEAIHYKPLFSDCDVIGLDYTVWKSPGAGNLSISVFQGKRAEPAAIR